MAQVGLALVVSDAPVTRFIRAGTWRVHIFSDAWAGRTVTVKYGNTDDITKHLASTGGEGAFTDDGQIIIDGGCYISVESDDDYENLTALVALASP